MFQFMDRFDRLDGGEMTLRIIEKNPGNTEQIPFYYYDILVDGRSEEHTSELQSQR